mmetsp:Transcript_128964/g.210191  ORF Transcript_128964/g.210191 Transcript_128964/m.210191 type:complete len:90 (+) Transcript_128964:734-1003(+)
MMTMSQMCRVLCASPVLISPTIDFPFHRASPSNEAGQILGSGSLELHALVLPCIMRAAGLHDDGGPFKAATVHCIKHVQGLGLSFVAGH